MRVVAGTARGRRLRAPAGRATRPTSDAVREAVFSVLASLGMLEGAKVLDLFAGSGALGIEALSRGAASATFVERDTRACEAIEANLEVLGAEAKRAKVIRGDVFAFLERTAERPDVVLADPPYSFGRWGDLLVRLEDRAGLLVAEGPARLEAPPSWETVKVKRYGTTVVTVLRPHREGDS